MNTAEYKKAAQRLLTALGLAQRLIFRLLLWRTLLWCCILFLGASLVLFGLEKAVYMPALWRILILGTHNSGNTTRLN